MNVNDLDAYSVFCRVMESPDLSEPRAGLTPVGDLGRAPARLSLGELVEFGCWFTLGLLILYMLLRWATS